MSVPRTRLVEAAAEAVRRQWMTVAQAALSLGVTPAEIRIELRRATS